MDGVDPGQNCPAARVRRGVLPQCADPRAERKVKPAGRFALVLVTAPDLKTARRLAQAALKGRLVACANLVTGIESHYWWQGKIERGAEVLLLFKTTRNRLKALEELLVQIHPYDTP